MTIKGKPVNTKHLVTAVATLAATGWVGYVTAGAIKADKHSEWIPQHESWSAATLTEIRTEIITGDENARYDRSLIRSAIREQHEDDVEWRREVRKDLSAIQDSLAWLVRLQVERRADTSVIDAALALFPEQEQNQCSPDF